MTVLLLGDRDFKTQDEMPASRWHWPASGDKDNYCQHAATWQSISRWRQTPETLISKLQQTIVHSTVRFFVVYINASVKVLHGAKNVGQGFYECFSRLWMFFLTTMVLTWNYSRDRWDVLTLVKGFWPLGAPQIFPMIPLATTAANYARSAAAEKLRGCGVIVPLRQLAATAGS